MIGLRKIIFFLNDTLCLTFALLGATWLRFEQLEPRHIQLFFQMLPASIPTALCIFYFMGLYNRSLRFTSIPDMVAIFTAVTCVSMTKVGFMYFNQEIPFSRSILILDWILSLFLIGASRLTPRLLLIVADKEPFRTYVYGKSKNRAKRVLIFGAGRAGESVAREIRRNEHLPYEIVGYIDDSPSKFWQMIHGVRVLGNRNAINRIVKEHDVDEIIVAIPSSSGDTIREIVRLFRDSKVRFLTLPGMQDLLEGKLLSQQLREISVEDLLRRSPAEINLSEIAAYITDKIVLITGAGGSIGSEICRQVLPFQPKALLLLGQGENSIYGVHQDLQEHPKLGGTRLVPIIGDIKDEGKIEAIFTEYKPQIVFHAAAHKHVPLMETNPEEAVKNNIRGTFNLVKISHECGIERFVMISTDKAVNPTSVMGATKRVAEMVLKAYAKKSATRFCAVRFGNVLGSRGSVIPLFKKQIERGGPITVTHPNMIRYFMTIPEASRLVIQAGAFGKGGEVFLLDMGDPVKIADLASDLIRLAGLEEGKDIKIEFSGVRSGEKLFEELLTAEEGVTATRNKKIFIAKPEEIDEEKLVVNIVALLNAAQSGQKGQIIEGLKTIVPSFAPDRDHIYNETKFKNNPRLELKKAKGHLKVV
ncbi:MAG: polysaccharide biosynthesis protein [Candidatus Riflebacteria bacterium]|nr:polysaccharide biosynthesis protein [Candidatus Riflebacteria bacterium]